VASQDADGCLAKWWRGLLKSVSSLQSSMAMQRVVQELLERGRHLGVSGL
jgi:hypothetical protein